ncbi:helix-turn-helix domain-containing protein [Roseibium sp.]|uniref:helix-turn-helix domain-containing protein n=1 Tax=Roseibium sp. TaxID=1936156 RepID=UPI003A96BE76
MPLLQQNDILFAHKALNVMPGLSAAARRVAGAIIDHFNKKTGQCDPSVGRLVTLLNISRAAVIRATNELDDLGLIQKRSHGGKSHRTAYLPNWPRFREIAEAWDAGMKSGEGPVCEGHKVSEMKPSQSQSRDLEGRKNETQTLRKNLSKKPVEAGRADLPAAQNKDPSKVKGTDSLLKGSNSPSQCSFLLPIQGRKTHSRSEVARNKAQQRWEDDLMRLDRKQTEAIAEWLTRDTMDRATEAEMATPGGGLELIIREMKDQLVNA